MQKKALILGITGQDGSFISELLLKADLRKKIGSEARKYALSQYDAEIVAQKTYNAYLKILEK